jgi:hypothetical protein
LRNVQTWAHPIVGLQEIQDNDGSSGTDSTVTPLLRLLCIHIDEIQQDQQQLACPLDT